MELNSDYNLEIERVVSEIRKQHAKLVCIQLPEGLKPLALKITTEIESKTKAKCLIWMNSCFGACDVPNLDHIKPKIDLIVQWGHTDSIEPISNLQ
jgi:2-(3-amino-3-carboxypropyl)histidine synthase